MAISGCPEARGVPNAEPLEVHVCSESWITLLVAVLRRSGFHYEQLIDFGRFGVKASRPKVVVYSQDPIEDPIASDEVLADILNNEIRSMWIGCRRAIPCPKRFFNLAIKPETQLPWVHCHYPSLGSPMLMPFAVGHDRKITISSVTELVAFTLKHAVRQTSMREVATAYIEFLEFADALMREDEYWKKSKGYTLDLAISQFKQAGSN